MNKWRILKYEMSTHGSTAITLRTIHQILTVQWQGYYPVIWVLQDQNSPSALYNFRTLQTGEEFEFTQPLDYIGTFQHLGYVGHVFKEKIFTLI